MLRLGWLVVSVIPYVVFCIVMYVIECLHASLSHMPQTHRDQ